MTTFSPPPKRSVQQDDFEILTIEPVTPDANIRPPAPPIPIIPVHSQNEAVEAVQPGEGWMDRTRNRIGQYRKWLTCGCIALVGGTCLICGVLYELWWYWPIITAP